VFNLLGLLVTLVNLPLWPANGDALARGDLGWVRRTTRRMTVVSVLAALVPGSVLALSGDRLLAAWLPLPPGTDRWLLVGLAAWMVTLAANSPRTMVQNAAGVVRPQLLGVSLYLVLSTVGKWYAARWYGIHAVPYVSVLGYALTVVPCAWYGYRRTLATHPPHRRSQPRPVLAAHP
jgi:O-antigen/teichoic acid export membrane protein